MTSRRARRRAADLAQSIGLGHALTDPSTPDPAYAHDLDIMAALRPRVPVDEPTRLALRDTWLRGVEALGNKDQQATPAVDTHPEVSAAEEIVQSAVVLSDQHGRVGLSDIDRIPDERAQRAMDAVERVLERAHRKAT